MVQATCTPNNHLGDYDFLCSNEDCQYGQNGMRSVLCQFCCFEDHSNRTLFHCDTCHVLYITNLASNTEEEKKEEDPEDVDDDDEAWFMMIE